MLTVRKATLADFETVMGIYEYARGFMKSTGNPNQWKNTHPTAELIKDDIENGICHVFILKTGNQELPFSGENENI